jgi:hypothetical protein
VRTAAEMPCVSPDWPPDLAPNPRRPKEAISAESGRTGVLDLRFFFLATSDFFVGFVFEAAAFFGFGFDFGFAFAFGFGFALFLRADDFDFAFLVAMVVFVLSLR